MEIGSTIDGIGALPRRRTEHESCIPLGRNLAMPENRPASGEPAGGCHRQEPMEQNNRGPILIIKGITRDGRKFRPSDWAQRLTTAVATQTRGRRIRFHPGVRMASIEGVNAVVVDVSLKDEEPLLFDFLVNFAKGNNLQIEESEGPGRGAESG
jgi:hypothetical protein